MENGKFRLIYWFDFMSGYAHFKTKLGCRVNNPLDKYSLYLGISTS